MLVRSSYQIADAGVGLFGQSDVDDLSQQVLDDLVVLLVFRFDVCVFEAVGVVFDLADEAVEKADDFEGGFFRELNAIHQSGYSLLPEPPGEPPEAAHLRSELIRCEERSLDSFEGCQLLESVEVCLRFDEPFSLSKLRFEHAVDVL